MKKIPLHSLVVMVGPNGAGKSTIASAKFPQYEVVSSDAIREWLVGDIRRQEFNNVVFREVHRRVALKLSLGERVVVDATHLRKDDRMAVTEIGVSLGVPVFYVVVNRPMEEKAASAGRDGDTNLQKQEDIFRSSERDILRGDGVAYVIDTRKEDFEVVSKLPSKNVLEAVKSQGFQGIMAIGDVHGMKDSLQSAIEWAVARNLFMVFLGDVLDYGPDSVQCTNMVYDLVMRGKALMTKGNHEHKIERWFDQVRAGDVRLKLSEGNKATTNAVEAMSDIERKRFECRFRALVNHARNHWVIGEDTLFTHGAAEPEMFRSHHHRLIGRLESMALFGEVDSKEKLKDGYPNRIYKWVDRIPSGKRVVVGHDIRSMGAPLVVKGALGGEAIFLDTGSGKGGHLTTAHIMFKDDGLEVGAYTTH